MQEPKISGGYILLSRKIIESEIWDKPPLYLKVWIYILSRVQYKSYKNLKRGEAIISIPEIIEACSHKVGYRIERPTKKQIFGILEWLRRSDEGVHEGNDGGHMIVTTKVTHGMLLKVLNYNVYQDPKSYEGNNEGQSEVTTKGQRRERQGNNNNKNDKNDKNVNKDYTSKIKSLLTVFSSIEDFNNLNKKYWDIIRETRITRKIAKSVIYNAMKKWKKYDPVIIEYALKTHIESHAGKREEYTIGIMRRTKKEEATTRLNKLASVKSQTKSKDDVDALLDKYREE